MPRLLSALFLGLLLAFPVLAAESAISESNSMRDAYGSSLLMVGDDLVVGETSGFSNTGMVHVLRRNERGSWDVIQTLSSPDAAISDRFGMATAHAEGVLAVSSTGALDGRGAVYVFEVSSDGQWELAARLTSDSSQGDGFGAAIAVADGHVFVSAAGESRGAGRVHVYSSATDWAESTVMMSPVDEESIRFGSSLAITGSMLAVGAPGASDNGGRVDFFSLSDLTPAGAIEPGEGQDNARLGTALFASGDHLLLANPRADRGMGSVHVYRMRNNEWRLERTLSSPSEGSRAFFGMAMAGSDEEVLISEQYEN